MVHWSELPRLSEEDLEECRQAFVLFDKDGACNAWHAVRQVMRGGQEVCSPSGSCHGEPCRQCAQM